MIAQRIEQLEASKKIRKRLPDIPKMRSLLESSKENAIAALSILLTDIVSTIVFVSVYESIRKLGDCKWWLIGYEPVNNHEVTMEILMEDNDPTFTHVDRFRRIRHDANYRGYKVTFDQAKEIIGFWDKQGLSLLETLKGEVEKRT
ncbi:MAG TPA: hypothetical protein VJH22_01055 [Candidatus Nanoarchaeia archaeon]|nr:hypothetical protein [Candidatus Nanoarchaeia archaeon]